jgi:hypothetical protein
MHRNAPGIKHLIECHCTLKIYTGSENHLYHKFPVYSKFNDSGNIIEKFAQCNNCQTIHKVHDFCKSNIIRSGKDDHKTAISKEDIACQLSDKISSILWRYECDISTWEQILDYCENEYWNQKIVINRDLIEGKYHVKILTLLSENKIKIENQVIENDIKF